MAGEQANPEAGEEQPEAQVRAPYVVGIGASAGGLQPLQEFFGSMPQDSGLAFVIVQHLSPEFKSLMGDLLSRHTNMALHRVEHGMPLQADSIYLIPPKKNLAISDGKLFLTDQDLTQGHPVNFPIDIFLNSLAGSLGDLAIGVILSGTDSDGTRGVRAINEAGGVVLVQEPETAEFDGMPRSAIATGLADYVLPPRELARAIYDYATNAPGGVIKTATETASETILGRITTLVARDQRSADLELDPQQTKENLQTTIEELETTNEEQQATNEELLASNEELQSTNEERQSVNEELYSVNVELQTKIGELTALNNDMDNLLRSTDIGIVFLDKDLRIRKFTPAVTGVIKLLEHDVGRPLDQISCDIEMGHQFDHVKHVLESGEHAECDVTSRRGTSLLLRIDPYRDEAGRTDGVVLTFVDISELKRAELQSRLLQMLMHTIITSTDFEAAMESTLANVCQAFGWDYAEAWLPRSDEGVLECCYTFVGRPDLEPFCEARGQLKLPANVGLPGRVWSSKEPQWVLDLNAEPQRVVHADMASEAGLEAGVGVPMVVPAKTGLKSALGVPLLAQDTVEVILTFFLQTTPRKRDLKSMVEVLSPLGLQLGTVIQRKRMDTALREAYEELQHKNEEMEQFVHTVSHDLKSPLVTIGGVLGMLKEELQEGRLIDAGEIIATGEDTVARMQSMIEHLLKLSRLGRAVSDLRSVELRPLIEKVIRSHQIELDRQRATVELTLDVPSVWADRNRLAEALDNLLVNALKYACDGPEPRIEFGSEMADSEVRLFVRDHGPGIEPQQFESIFGLFQQLDAGSEGSGVGLAIVRRIMEVHHGRAWVESSLGEGATFWLALPVGVGEGVLSR